MKIKNSFVTNSSSTSFIVFTRFEVNNDSDFFDHVKKKKIKKRLNEDFVSGNKLKVEDNEEVTETLTEYLHNGTILGLPYDLPRDNREFSTKSKKIYESCKGKSDEERWEILNKFYDEREKAHKEACRDLAKKIIEKHLGETVHFLIYASDTGDSIAADIRYNGRNYYSNVFMSTLIEVDNS